MTRRTFLASASAAGAVLGAATAMQAAPAQGANDRIALGIIGAGDRAATLVGQITELASSHNVQIIALCDVWQQNLHKMAERVTVSSGSAPKTFTRFGDLLALDQIDAVVIATPDFAHGPILIAALEAGKDAYVEKPMAMRIEHANRALDLARAAGRIVQVGTQYRSDGGYIAAARELAADRIGHVSRISAAANFNHPRWARDVADCKPEDVDWQAYLLDLPDRPFDPKLLRRWHLYRDCTNGLSGLWMSHYVDAVHLLTGATYPSSAVAHGGIYVWKDGREHTDNFHALLEYPAGFLFDWGMSLTNAAGTHFLVQGAEGVLDLGTNYLGSEALVFSSAGGGRDSRVETHNVVRDQVNSHMANWLQCLRSRELPRADIQFGHQHAVATIMAAEALVSGRRQSYDPAARSISA